MNVPTNIQGKTFQQSPSKAKENESFEYATINLDTDKVEHFKEPYDQNAHIRLI